MWLHRMIDAGTMRETETGAENVGEIVQETMTVTAIEVREGGHPTETSVVLEVLLSAGVCISQYIIYNLLTMSING